MSTANYISVIERYHEYRTSIHDIMASILTGLAEEKLIRNKETRVNAAKVLGKRFPFIDMLFVLDEEGKQLGDNITTHCDQPGIDNGDGLSRCQRPYFRMLTESEDDVIVTDPYLSIVSRSLCISAIMKWNCGGEEGYLVVDADLVTIVEFLMGDSQRRKFQPFFKFVYAVIVIGLFCVVIALLYSAFYELYLATTAAVGSQEAHLKPFGVIIFLTLALAIFDLGKTTLEEEVLMQKDIFRHSSTRRTITRFVAAILIAVSIESLLLMFKAALGQGEQLIPAVWMMLAAVGLLVGLGLYVYLGAKAEALLRRNGDIMREPMGNSLRRQ